MVRSRNGTLSDERLREEQTGTDERLREEQTGTDERLREEQTGTDERETTPMSHRGILIKVVIFTVVMLLVAAGLVVVFGQFRFAPTSGYHANFTTASRLKAGNDVRIAGVPVGKVRGLKLNPDNSVDVAFDVDKRYQLYTSTRADIRYLNLVGDRYLEIASGPGDLRKLPVGATIDQSHTEPALDLDALLGGLRPVLKGLDGNKINEISNAIIQLLQGQGGALADLLSNTGSFTQSLADRYQVISDVIHNLNTVLGTVNEKSAQFDASVDQLQQLVTGLAQGRDPIAGAIPPLASAETDLTDMLQRSRRPLQGVIENVRPLATEMDNRKGEINKVIEPLAENYLRLEALGAYGAFFNIFYCTVRIKINGFSTVGGHPFGGDSDILIPQGGPPDPSKGRCSPAK
jgi:phospholipid/cholesterol/gamma-HCH transport system substrate-binding protein